MCEFCTKHGEGQKWYLQAANYSEDLMSDLKRRQFIKRFIEDPARFSRSLQKLEDMKRLPAYVRDVISPVLEDRQKRSHYGQVLPIEDIALIFGFVNSVVRLPCLCRHSSFRHCYALSMVPYEQSQLFKLVRDVGSSYLTGPDNGGLEVLSRESALASFRRLEQQGLCHTVWTFVTPFIGSICNCDRVDCVAMRATFDLEYPMLFHGEWTAEVNPELCDGCRQCLRLCQFGAMGYSVANRKVVVDTRRCYGCGICRAACYEKAICLKPL